jgi:hypothetical protein
MKTPHIDVSVAAHYVPKRVPFLAQVLEAIADWDRPSVAITLVTNDLALADEAMMLAAVAKLEARGFSVTYDKVHGLEHPWHLTWWHKTHLREWHSREGSPEDLFMYVEDDIVVSRENLAYFQRFLPSCKAAGVLPGFLRYESLPDGTRMSPDARGYQAVTPAQIKVIDGQTFVAPIYSYWAGFVLDRELCSEYLASPWSNIETADTMSQSHRHSCRVQSAWALTFQQVPAGLPSRYVVPVDQSCRPLTCCQVWHSANNYTVSKQYNFGTVRMDDMFMQSKPRAALRQLAWDASALRRRVLDKGRRVLGGS